MGAILRKLFPKQDVRILLNGLDAAGKTTILYRLKLGEVVTTIPTIGFNVETIQYKNISLTAWDTGGREKMRPLWRHYYQGMSAFVVVVDSNDRERLDAAKEELINFTKETDYFHKAAIAIVCNKQDLPNCATVREIYDQMDLGTVMKGHDRWSMFATSAMTGEGLHDVMEWICNAVKNNDKDVDDKQKQDKDSKITESLFVRSVEKLKNLFITM